MCVCLCMRKCVYLCYYCMSVGGYECKYPHTWICVCVCACVILGHPLISPYFFAWSSGSLVFASSRSGRYFVIYCEKIEVKMSHIMIKTINSTICFTLLS